MCFDVTVEEFRHEVTRSVACVAGQDLRLVGKAPLVLRLQNLVEHLQCRIPLGRSCRQSGLAPQDDAALRIDEVMGQIAGSSFTVMALSVQTSIGICGRKMRIVLVAFPATLPIPGGLGFLSLPLLRASWIRIIWRPRSPRLEALHADIGPNLGPVHRQMTARDQPHLTALAEDLVHQLIEKTAFGPPLIAQPGQRRMIGNRIMEVLATEPAHARMHLHLRTQLPVTQVVQHPEHHHPKGKLRVDAGTSPVGRVTLGDRIGDEAQIQHRVDLPEHVVARNQTLHVHHLEERWLGRIPGQHRRAILLRKAA